MTFKLCVAVVGLVILTTAGTPSYRADAQPLTGSLPYASAQLKILPEPAGISSARFVAEREEFYEDEKRPGRYATAGRFGGLGMVHFSPETRLIEFKGLKPINGPFGDQERDDKYEFFVDTFSLSSVIRLNATEYAFQGTQGNTINRISGRIRITLPPPTGPRSRVQYFEMNEEGSQFPGVMNRYRLPQRNEAISLMKEMPQVFFGGNYVALDWIGTSLSR